MKSTDEFLEKLEPIMPERVRRWQRLLDTTDARTRSLIARQIAAVAHSQLADPRQLLLSLPPKRRVAGELNLGTVRYDTPRWPAGISESELLQNLAIFGRSGAGKTNAAFHLLLQLANRRTPFVFLDWKRTARHLLPQLPQVKIHTPGRDVCRFPFNPFAPPPGLEPRVFMNLVVDVLCDSYTLGDGARSLLQKALLAEFNEDRVPTARALLDGIRAVPEKERVRGWKTSAIRAVETVCLMTQTTTHQEQERFVNQLLRGQTVIELDGLSPSNRKFLLPVLCLWLYYARLPHPAREQLGLVVFIEEAHHVLYQHRNQNETVMEALLRQCREIGIAIVVIDQHPHLISSAALGNTYTSLCLNLKDPKDIRRAAELSLMKATDARHLSLLPVGRAIVKLQDRWRKPFLIDLPHRKVTKGAITDSDLARRPPRPQTLSTTRAPENLGIDALARSRAPDEAMEEDARRFMEDVETHPNDGVDARYRRLGMSADKGSRLKDKLVALRLLDEESVATGRTRRTLLRAKSHRTPPESIGHEYLKRLYSHRYEELGYAVTIEAPRAQGRMDVLAVGLSERIAIEVETGLSDVVQNVRQDLLSGCTRVVVVATNERAWVKVHRALDAAGLLVPAVEIVIGDQELARAGRQAR